MVYFCRYYFVICWLFSRNENETGMTLQDNCKVSQKSESQSCEIHGELLNTGCVDCMNIIEKIAETCQVCGNKWSLTCH